MRSLVLWFAIRLSGDQVVRPGVRNLGLDSPFGLYTMSAENNI